MDNKILLSICVPTYNRAETVYNSIKSHLEFKSNDIEVVVCDNGSDDNTVELLKSIDDKRLRVYKNGENKGFSYNMNKVLRLAKGDFALLMSDEDFINKDVLEPVLQILNQNKIKENIGAFIFNSIFENDENFSKEDEFLMLISGKATYMSGIVFNKLKMDSNDFEIMDTIYPHIGYLLKMCCKGTIYFCKLDLYIEGKASSFIDKDLNPNNYNKPEQRLLQFEQDSKLILSLKNLDIELKISLLMNLFNTKFIMGTLGYDLLLRKSKLKSNLSENINIFKEKYKEIFNFIINTPLDYVYHQNLDPIMEYALKIKNNREEFDNLVNNNYKIILVSNNTNNIKLLLHFNFKIDYFYFLNENKLYNINLEEINTNINYDNVLFIIDGDNEKFIDNIQNINFNNFKEIYLQNLKLYY